MSVRLGATIGYGITDFDVSQTDRLNIPMLTDEEILTEYVENHPFLPWLEAKNDFSLKNDLIDDSISLYADLSNAMKENSTVTESSFIMDHIIYSPEFGLENVILFTGMNYDSTLYDNLILHSIFYDVLEFDSPQVLLLKHPIYPEFGFFNTLTGKNLSEIENHKMNLYLNNKILVNPEDEDYFNYCIPRVPSYIKLLLEYLNLFKDSKELDRLKPMIYFYFS